MILCFTIVMQGLSNVNSAPQLNSIILYMAGDNPAPDINTEVNITVVFKNLLDVEFDMYNVTAEIKSDATLNVTNVNDVSIDNEINETDLFVYGTNSTAVFEWNHTDIKVAWALYEVNMTQTFWFIVNCTEGGTKYIQAPILTYELDGEVETFNGKTFEIEVVEEGNVSSIPNPVRGDWVLFWWFTGSIVITFPLIVIVITRLTLWKR